MSNFSGLGPEMCPAPLCFQWWFPCWWYPYIFELTQYAGCLWFQLISETQLIVRRERRSCCEKLCHSDLHRESHMVVSCRITLQGVQCLTQGHVSNPAWKLRPIAQYTFCIFWHSVSYIYTSCHLNVLWYLNVFQVSNVSIQVVYFETCIEEETHLLCIWLSSPSST